MLDSFNFLVCLTLEFIDSQLSDQDVLDLSQKLSATDIEKALHLSANGTGPGLNGITYEVWKSLHTKFLEDKKSGDSAFDIIGTMTKVFNDIETYIWSSSR
jgi:hypothetical protein